MGGEQLFALLIMAALNAVPRTRELYSHLLPFAIFWILFDALRVLTPHIHALVPPHVEGPYRVELALFGVRDAAGKLVTLPEWFGGHTHVVADLLSAFAYGFYFYEPFVVLFFLFAKDKELCRRYGVAFLALNLLGFVTYYLLPVAPPWYVQKYGFGPAQLGIPGDPARLAAVDELLGITYFHGLYARAANVFGAVPSLHAAYPLLLWLYVRKRVVFAAGAVMLCYWLLVCFAAVYLGHHYFIDVLLGSTYGALTYVVVERVTARARAAIPLRLESEAA
jgi:inositol phosphorylceramide synthase catalytic subunit